MKSKRALILLVLLTLAPWIMLGFPTHEVNARTMLLGDNIQAIRVVNSSSIHVLDPVNITTIIENPTTWTLKNISFSVTIPKDVKIISALNDSNTNTTIIAEEDSYIIKVNISTIKMSTSYIHWIIIKFTKEGEKEIGESTIKMAKQKGELIEEDTIICPAISLTVLKSQKVPQEGTRDMSMFLIVVLIILPLGLMAISHKIAARPEI